MPTTLLVKARHGEEPEAIGDSGVEVLARYPDMILVRGTDEQVTRLRQSGIDVTPLPEQPVLVSGNSFTFAEAVAVAVQPQETQPGRTAYYLLKLAGPPAPEWLRELDGEIHDSLPNFTLLVGIRPERLGELRARPWVEGITPYRAAMKISPKLRAEHELADEPRLVEIAVFAGERTDTTTAQIREAGGTVVSATSRSIVATVDGQTIARLANSPSVQVILPYNLPELHNDRAAQVMRLPAGHSFASGELKGANQIVAITDSGLDTGDPDTIHADIRGRVAGIVSWPVKPELALLLSKPPGDDGPADERSGHGTHVTGSVLGDGRSATDAGETPVPAGVAPQATVFFQAVDQEVHWKDADELRAAGIQVPRDWPPPSTGLYGLPVELGRLFEQAYEAGARIHTNSWGAATSGEYTENARTVDDFMWRHPDTLILFSAGNEGVDEDRSGVIDPDSVGSPGTAKNCLTVGASENDRPHGSTPLPGRDANWEQFGRWPRLAAAGHVSDDIDGMAAFSSRGPVDGDRIKPDVVAPGTNVLSMLSSKVPGQPLWGLLPVGHPLRQSYCWSGGTSMSTPLVAGAAALVRQHLVEQRRHQPSGALIKAFLVNGAAPMRGQFPGEVMPGNNNVTGFGRVDLTATIRPGMLFADDPADAVATGETREYQVDGVEPGEPLAVTLVWTDAPSQPGNGSLVNQLYLQVLTPIGTVLDGDLTPFPLATNNVQRITIQAPAGGRYTIRVHGVSVVIDSPGAAPTGNLRQDFALAVANGDTLTKDSRR